MSETPPAHKTAVCISGRCHSLQYTYLNIRQTILDPLGDYDLFMYVPADDFSHHARLLNPTVLKVAADRPIDEGQLVNHENCRFKTGVQAYLQQLYALKMCNRLRVRHARRSGTAYDWVVRCRPDLFFLNSLPELSTLDPAYVYLPDFHHFDGCNDRFAIGSSDKMDVYFNKFDDIHDYVSRVFDQRGVAVSAEMFTIGHLSLNRIETRTLPIRFNRVRDYGMRNDLNKTNRKVKTAPPLAV